MEFVVRHGLLARMGLQPGTADMFHCGYCDAFVAGSDTPQVIEEIKKHVATHEVDRVGAE